MPELEGKGKPKNRIAAALEFDPAIDKEAYEEFIGLIEDFRARYRNRIENADDPLPFKGVNRRK